MLHIEECGSERRNVKADSPIFMTYMAWERSSLLACSTAWYSPPESTLMHLITTQEQDPLRCAQTSYGEHWHCGAASRGTGRSCTLWLTARQVSSDRGRTLTARRGARAASALPAAAPPRPAAADVLCARTTRSDTRSRYASTDKRLKTWQKYLYKNITVRNM